MQALCPHISELVTLKLLCKVLWKLADLAASIDNAPMVTPSFDQEKIICDKIYQLNEWNSVFTHQA